MRVRPVLSVLLFAVAASAAPARAQQAGGEPVVLDAHRPLMVAAALGQVAWVDQSDPSRLRLKVRDAGGAVRTLPTKLPRYVFDLTLGTDASGRITAVVGALDAKKGNLESLWSVGTAPGKPSGLRKVPVSELRLNLGMPGLRQGVLSFLAVGRRDADFYARTRLMRTELVGKRKAVLVADLGSQRIYSNTGSYPAADGSVLISRAESDVDAGTVKETVTAYRPGGRARVVLKSRCSAPDVGVETDSCGFSAFAVTAEGVAVARWAAATDGDVPVTAPRDVQLFPDGGEAPQALSAPRDASIALPVGTEGFVTYDVGGGTTGLYPLSALRFVPVPVPDAPAQGPLLGTSVST